MKLRESCQRLEVTESMCVKAASVETPAAFIIETYNSPRRLCFIMLLASSKASAHGRTWNAEYVIRSALKPLSRKAEKYLTALCHVELAAAPIIALKLTMSSSTSSSNMDCKRQSVQNHFLCFEAWTLLLLKPPQTAAAALIGLMCRAVPVGCADVARCNALCQESKPAMQASSLTKSGRNLHSGL